MHLVETDMAPIMMDPRPCGLCGLTIDRHERDDTPEGPIFFCADIDPEEMTLIGLERRAELRLQEEIAATVARLEAADDPSKRPPLALRAEPYHPAQSTIDAFFYLVRSDDVERLKSWLADHQRDAPFLLKLLEDKQC